MPTARAKVRGNINNTTLSPLLGVREVSRILHIHEQTLRRWSDQGIIKVYRIGVRGDRRFRREDVATLLAEATQHRRKRMHINGADIPFNPAAPLR